MHVDEPIGAPAGRDRDRLRDAVRPGGRGPGRRRRRARQRGPRVRARRDRGRAARRPAAAAAGLGAAGPVGLPRRAARRGARGGRGQRGRRRGRRRHRHRLHRLHGAAHAGRRHAAVRACRSGATGRTRTSSSGSTTPRSRRPTGSTRWRTSAASRGSAATAAGCPRSGSWPRACSCSRRTRRSTPRRERWVEAADWIVWQLCGRYVRNVCTAGYKGVYQDGHYPSRDFLGALDSASSTSSTTRSSSRWAPLGSAAGGLSEEAAALDRPARRHRGGRRQRRRARDRCRRRGPSSPAQMLMVMGTSTCHVMNARRAGRGARHVRRGRRRHHARDCGATRPARAAVGDIFAWWVRTGVPPAYAERAAAAGVGLHEYLTGLAARQAGRRARAGRAGLAQRQPVGAGRPRAVRAGRRADPGAPGRRTSTGRCWRPPRSAPGRSSRRSRPRGAGARAGRRRRADQERVPHADLRRRDCGGRCRCIESAQGPALGSAIHAAVAAGAYPDVAGRRRGDGRRSAGRVHPGRARADALRRAVRGVPRRCTTTSAAGGNDVMHRLRRASATAQPRVRPDDADRADQRPSVDRARHEVAPCTPSWSATAWSPGPRATCPARVPGADLFVIKPSGVAYDELDAGRR